MPVKLKIADKVATLRLYVDKFNRVEFLFDGTYTDTKFMPTDSYPFFWPAEDKCVAYHMHGGEYEFKMMPMMTIFLNLVIEPVNRLVFVCEKCAFRVEISMSNCRLTRGELKATFKNSR